MDNGRLNIRSGFSCGITLFIIVISWLVRFNSPWGRSAALTLVLNSRAARAGSSRRHSSISNINSFLSQAAR